MTVSVRPLTDDDAAVSRQLGFEAFGVPPTPPAAISTLPQPGHHWFGAFEDGELVARMSDREFDSWFAGAAVPTAGLASVTVAAEHRGRGAFSPLILTGLRAARERGAVISTLFPTAPRIYRRFGYELISAHDTVSVPTQVLADAGAGSARTRRAGEDDVEGIRDVYDGWAAAQNGPLTRRGVSYPLSSADFLGRFTGVTVAEDADGISGFVSWTRSDGYGEEASMQVRDLIARTPEGYRSLLAVIGSFAGVAPTTLIDTSGDDLVRLFVPTLHWQVVHSAPYMLKILDIPGALGLVVSPPGWKKELSFALKGDVLTDNDGAYGLSVDDGSVRCARVEKAERSFSPHGLALAYAGAQSCANLRAIGHLSGGDLAEDPAWDALFGGRQLHIRDDF
ncbi:MAG TPA: GNAT family N-acetyltransferase [Propionibacteriaceae bacterium]